MKQVDLTEVLDDLLAKFTSVEGEQVAIFLMVGSNDPNSEEGSTVTSMTNIDNTSLVDLLMGHVNKTLEVMDGDTDGNEVRHH